MRAMINFKCFIDGFRFIFIPSSPTIDRSGLRALAIVFTTLRLDCIRLHFAHPTPEVPGRTAAVRPQALHIIIGNGNFM